MNMENITKALLALLSKGIVTFTYRKVDGTIRNAVGTRNLDMLRTAYGIFVPTPKTGRNNPTAYYDIDKEDWRSFKAENVLAINGIDIKEIKGVSGGRVVKVDEPIEVEIPINVGYRSGVGVLPKSDNEPIGDFDLKMLKSALGMPIGETKKGELPKREDAVFSPLAVSEEHIALPISGMSIEDFAKLVAKYAVGEFIGRIK